MAVAIGVMNLATYASTLLAARLLGPQAYGGFAAVTGLLLVVGVLMLGLQTTGARRVAASPGHVGEIERALMRVTYRSAWVLAGVCLLLTPGLRPGPEPAEHGDGGDRRAGRVADDPRGRRGRHPAGRATLAAARRVSTWRWALARLAGTLLLFWKPEEWVAALSMAIGFAGPGRRRLAGPAPLRAAMRSQESSGHHDERAIVRELGANSHALLAFFALSNADVILSRFVLDPHSSGLYAGGLILVKSLLFLPQFVIIVAFPSMSTEAARRADARQERGRDPRPRRAVGTLAVLVFSDVALIFVGGSEYAAHPGRVVDLRPPRARCSRPCSCWSTASWPGSRGARST